MKTLILLLSCIMLWAATPSVGVTASLTFQNYGFAIDELKTNENGVFHQVLIMNLPTKNGAFTPSVSVIIQPFEGTLEDYLRIYRQHIIDLGWTVIDRATSEEKYTFIEFSGMNQGVTYHSYIRIEIGDGKAYIITAIAEESQWLEVSAELVASVASFKLIGEQKLQLLQ